MRMIDADRLLEVLRYNRQHTDEWGDTYQMVAVNIDALIRFIENEILKERR